LDFDRLGLGSLPARSLSKQALNVGMDDDTSYSCVAAHLYIQRRLLNRRVSHVYSSEMGMVPMWSWIINFSTKVAHTHTHHPRATLLVKFHSRWAGNLNHGGVSDPSPFHPRSIGSQMTSLPLDRLINDNWGQLPGCLENASKSRPCCNKLMPPAQTSSLNTPPRQFVLGRKGAPMC
jgi:hypothetical protein